MRKKLDSGEIDRFLERLPAERFNKVHATEPFRSMASDDIAAAMMLTFEAFDIIYLPVYFTKPEVGDLVQWTIHEGEVEHEETFTKVANRDIIKAVWHKECNSFVSKRKIIQRNGKPVIHEVKND